MKRAFLWLMVRGKVSSIIGLPEKWPETSPEKKLEEIIVFDSFSR